MRILCRARSSFITDPRARRHALIPLVSRMLLLGIAPTAMAHTQLLAPNGGESLEVGTVFEIRWTVVVQHDTENWDLWHSTIGPDGPWTTIAEDLPVGDPSGGSEHTFAWTVPDMADGTVWVRVRQDNTGQDYDDVSDAAFAIVSSACLGDVDADGLVGFGDLLALLGAWGPCPSGCPEDIDGDGLVGFGDLLALLGAWGPCV